MSADYATGSRDPIRVNPPPSNLVLCTASSDVTPKKSLNQSGKPGSIPDPATLIVIIVIIT